MTEIAILVGNPNAASRTRLVAEEVGAQLAERTGATVRPTIDLADIADRVFEFPEPQVDGYLDAVAAADIVIIASPTYKGAYTGLLKAFLDRYSTDGLTHVVAVPLLSIGSPAHALAVEHTLRPLLVELGAAVPARGIAFPAADTDDRKRIIKAWLAAEWHRMEPTFLR